MHAVAEAKSRLLIYSHDTFGLGHLRRCRAIAHALVDRNPNLSVLILSGSPIIGSFDFKDRVDFIRIPGVIKLRNGAYASLKLNIATEETIAMRASIIAHTAEKFAPDLFLVDKEPLGLRGEVRDALELMRSLGIPSVLGLRDVMDDPDLLAPEWERKNVMPALESLYSQIWVYGLQQICDPLDGLVMPESVKAKMVYTGYLEREVQSGVSHPELPFDDPFILVTPGGGGDGELLVNAVISAYEHDRNMPHPAMIVLGPFMSRERQSEFVNRANALDDVHVTTFDAQIEHLVSRAVGVVAMGGYNTFCEILSFDKRALLVPRSVPRLEQTIRASQAERLGLVRMLTDEEACDAGIMVRALRTLPYQSRPSDVVLPGLLEGLDSVNRLFQQAVAQHQVHALPTRDAVWA